MHWALDFTIDARLVGDMSLWRAGKTARAVGEAARDGRGKVGLVEVRGGVFAVGAGLAKGVFA